MGVLIIHMNERFMLNPPPLRTSSGASMRHSSCLHFWAYGPRPLLEALSPPPRVPLSWGARPAVLPHLDEPLQSYYNGASGVSSILYVG